MLCKRLVILSVLALAVAESTASAQCVATPSCSGNTDALCDINTPDDAIAFACFDRKATKSCKDAVTDASALSSGQVGYDEKQAIRHYYMGEGDSCAASIQHSWLSTALWVEPMPGKITHALQVMPTVSARVGTPVFVGEEPTRGSRAFGGGLGALAGGTVRYSPFALWINVHGFYGVQTLSANKIGLTDTELELFPSPSMTALGGGLDFLNGVVGLDLGRATLHPNGPWSAALDAKEDGIWFVGASADLTALAVSAAGASKKP